MLKQYSTPLSYASDGRKGTSQTFAKISGVLATRIAALDLLLEKTASEHGEEYQSPVTGHDDLLHLINSRKAGFRHRFWCVEPCSKTGKLYREAKRAFAKRNVGVATPVAIATKAPAIASDNLTALESRQEAYVAELVRR